MATISERLNGWAKILAVAVPLAAGGLVGYGKMSERISATELARAEDKAAILRELNQMHDQLTRIENMLGPARR